MDNLDKIDKILTKKEQQRRGSLFSKLYSHIRKKKKNNGLRIDSGDCIYPSDGIFIQFKS